MTETSELRKFVHRRRQVQLHPFPDFFLFARACTRARARARARTPETEAAPRLPATAFAWPTGSRRGSGPRAPAVSESKEKVLIECIVLSCLSFRPFLWHQRVSVTVPCPLGGRDWARCRFSSFYVQLWIPLLSRKGSQLLFHKKLNMSQPRPRPSRCADGTAQHSCELQFCCVSSSCLYEESPGATTHRPQISCNPEEWWHPCMQ